MPCASFGARLSSYAIAAEDFPRALEFIENCAMSMVVKGDLLTLLSWEQQLPKELMSSQLEVKLALAWGMSLVTRFKEAEVLLTQVEAGTHESPAAICGGDAVPRARYSALSATIAPAARTSPWNASLGTGSTPLISTRCATWRATPT